MNIVPHCTCFVESVYDGDFLIDQNVDPNSTMTCLRLLFHFFWKSREFNEDIMIWINVIFL